MFKPVDPHPNFPKLEEEILKFWEDNKIFERSLEKNSPSPSLEKRGVPSLLQREGKGEFVFYDGPPFATGLPHYGHILASTIKDVVPRYQTMKGRFVRRRWGWDCHGLPIEEIVERKLKISGKKEIEKIGIKKFNETCRSMVLQYVNEWGKMVKRIARWVDFENSYKTMDRDYMESVWWAFKEIYKKGLVYEGRKVLLYCPRCETPISNFEVAMDNSYQTITEESVIVKFKVKNSPNPLFSKEGAKGEFPIYILSWTTTPWTLPGNVALAVGEDVSYVVVKTKNANYLLAKDIYLTRLSATLSDIGEGRGEVTGEFLGKDLLGLAYEPLFEVPGISANPKSFKVYGADFVNTEEGTGIVHTAVVYGEEDYELGQKVGLPVVPMLDEKGHFNDKAPSLVKGKYFKGAEKIIKDVLEKRGLLLDRKNHTHSYPHCWRCGTILFYNAIPAWFVNVQKIKNKILESNKKEISWYPEHLKFGRYAKSVEGAPDWNISRNRYWGNPIPIWRCKDCGKDTVVGSVEELQKKATMTPLTSPLMRGERGGSWNTFDLHRPYIDEVVLKCEHCGGDATRITEIFDSWFEAASMPFASVHYPFEKNSPLPSFPKRGVGGEFQFPAQFVAEYIAQTRAWFYVMHVQALILFGKAPFEHVVTTGTILAEDGSKMSKSKNNYPDPWIIMEKYGVDSLRFYLMNSVVMQADNLNFSERDLQIVYRKVILILWNVYNYFVTYAQAKSQISNLKSQTNSKFKIPNSKPILDQWILARLQELRNNVTKYLDSYDTVRATREIERFVNDLSTWYLRRSRGRGDKAFFDTLHYCLVELSKIIAPFMPYLAEAIYRNLSTPSSSPPSHGGERERVESVHLLDWPKVKKLTAKQTKLLREMREVRKIAEEVHALRAKAGIKLRQPLAKLTLPHNAPFTPSYLKRGEGELLDILKDEVNVLEIEFGDKLELDTKITPELKIAGLSRELERQIQQFRKESGLKIGEMVDLYYETKSDMLKKAMEKVDRKKVYVRELGIRNQELGVEKEIEVEGEKVKILMRTNANGNANDTNSSQSSHKSS